MISATQIHLQPQIRHIPDNKAPKECHFFKAETALFWGKWNPCFSDTVRGEIKDTKSLPLGNSNYL